MDKVLCFSGGKDSLAVLKMMREVDMLGEVLVIWADSGDSYPGKREWMEEWAGCLPHFQVVRGDVDEFIRTVGWPTDLLPERVTEFGRAVSGKPGRMFAPSRECCRANLWGPMADAVQAAGAKVVYRGDRREDKRRVPLEDGQVLNGITYRFPVLDWTTEAVLAYVGDELPEYYKAGEHASRDCVHCTAYLDENAARINALPAGTMQLIKMVLREQREAILQDLQNIDEVLDG